MGALLGNLEEGSYARGLSVEEGSEVGVSPYRGPDGKHGEGCGGWGDHLLGTLKIN
jgi:hypothetical protein